MRIDLILTNCYKSTHLIGNILMFLKIITILLLLPTLFVHASEVSSSCAEILLPKWDGNIEVTDRQPDVHGGFILRAEAGVYSSTLEDLLGLKAKSLPEYGERFGLKAINNNLLYYPDVEAFNSRADTFKGTSYEPFIRFSWTQPDIPVTRLEYARLWAKGYLPISRNGSHPSPFCLQFQEAL